MKCCICGKEIIGFGNNPYPTVKTPGVRCCDDCNNKFVIRDRILQMNQLNIEKNKS